MRPKLAPYFRVSGKQQEAENTIIRQTIAFESRWPHLAEEFDLFTRIPGGAALAEHYFLDEAYNLEAWDEQGLPPADVAGEVRRHRRHLR
ncbi:MAG: hypothetical protein KF767_03095 [Bdellovibrionaceae bacterium]|nr:hypothetical protein [Pseudobdellovibrionaceae bacterium]